MAFAGVRERSAAQALANQRAEFIRLTYLHLGSAILAFIALTTGIIGSGMGKVITGTLLGSQYSWLIVLGAFMAVGWVAERWARAANNPIQAYAGLALYVVAQAIIMTPLLYIATNFGGPNVIPTAGILTLLVFGGLTASVFITKKDFSFMRSALMMASFAAMGMIVVSILFGFDLGVLFSGAMVLVAGGYVLYYTSNVLHHYPAGAHVAASLALFSAIALLFWYILQVLMSLGRD
ncbi:MAG: FtsH-binding integral membrane protein [Myxococcota bacterium]|jgi:FtsH-binding integral membrane protein